MKMNRACVRCGGIAGRTYRAMMPPPWKHIDAGIIVAVRTLWENGIETFESCQGGDGHPFPEPTVRFHGHAQEGYRAFAIAQRYGLNPFSVRRYWSVQDGELVGPQWEMTFLNPEATP